MVATVVPLEPAFLELALLWPGAGHGTRADAVFALIQMQVAEMEAQADLRDGRDARAPW